MSKINEISEKVQSYINKQGTIPASITYDKVKYNYGKLNYIFLDYLLNNDTNIDNNVVSNAPKPNGQTINTELTKKEYTLINKTVYNFIKTHKRNPNYIIHKNHKINILIWVDVLSRIINFKNKNKRLPEKVKVTSKILKQNTSTKTTSKDEVFNYFVKVFGKVTTIDGAFSKVKDKGYGHYFNDFLTNKQTIDNLHGSGQKPNCTDSCQVFYHIAKALGYSVVVVHVRCSSGEGHVRLKLKHDKHTGGKWINRDPACIISKNGKSLTAIWCGNDKLLATNPAWFMASVDR